MKYRLEDRQFSYRSFRELKTPLRMLDKIKGFVVGLDYDIVGNSLECYNKSTAIEVCEFLGSQGYKCEVKGSLVVEGDIFSKQD